MAWGGSESGIIYPMNRKKILVTGGAGYIGSHMVLALQEAGYKPFVIDNLSRGHIDSIGSADFAQVDLRSEEQVKSLFANHQFDAVMHFAAMAYVAESVANPVLYYANNVQGTLNLLTAMSEANRPPLVFSSSCATYGEPQHLPISEDHPQAPINPYGQGKYFVESILQDCALAYGQNSISLRYFNAAGCDPLGRVGERHEPETHLIPLVLKEALRIQNGGDPTQTELQVFGRDFETRDGSCIRDFIHVSDLCRAHLLAVQRLLSNQTQGAEFFNLANGHGFSVLEVIETCRQVTGQPIQFQLKERRPGDPVVLVGDATLAANTLGWTPETSQLSDIVQSAWQWMLQTEPA